jgi:dihydroorotate dehydrogenase electron transfer subunit
VKRIVQSYFFVESCREVALNAYLLRFVAPEIASIALPGQFVNILTSVTGEGPLLRRPFSIARIDGSSIEILFNVIGKGTSLLSQKTSGSQIDVIGPLGKSFRIDDKYDVACVVAGGIGVAPFPFLTNCLLEKNKHVETFVGFRNSTQVFVDHLQNVHIATDDGSTGFHGNVIQLFESTLNKLHSLKIKIFSCGPTVMLKALIEFAKQNNISCELSLEEHMACGVGICQGCPVKRTNGNSAYALVCKDGPIFDSREIIL